jgi:hypothetical protein
MKNETTFGRKNCLCALLTSVLLLQAVGVAFLFCRIDPFVVSFPRDLLSCQDLSGWLKFKLFVFCVICRIFKRSLVKQNSKYELRENLNIY